VHQKIIVRELGVHFLQRKVGTRTHLPPPGDHRKRRAAFSIAFIANEEIIFEGSTIQPKKRR
jgi:hypothetical protein